MQPSNNLSLIGSQLMAHRTTAPWPWLSQVAPKPVDMQRANKWFLGCIIDYQIDADRAWTNAKRLAEGIFNDPNDLWGTISAYTEKQWMSKFDSYSLHRFPAAHKRVWRIGQALVQNYGGDARQTWLGKIPSAVLDTWADLRLGEQISRMALGGLLDTKQIHGAGDVKADSNVCRVTGRVVDGIPTSPERATQLTRHMNAPNPWLLDWPLYRLGKDICPLSEPKCGKCYMNKLCRYAQSR